MHVIYVTIRQQPSQASLHIKIQYMNATNIIEAQAIIKNYLRRHQQSKHEGKQFPCDLCEHWATTN
jgi:uncharacterized protein YdeI (YjbR/CyaY-like superfamily)